MSPGHFFKTLVMLYAIMIVTIMLIILLYLFCIGSEQRMSSETYDPYMVTEFAEQTEATIEMPS